uniref:Uncharacterized protein n=1 Tax=Octopus bimaculoides TaxID=37653 RepID=A0A0L8FTR8_OCTBM
MSLTINLFNCANLRTNNNNMRSIVSISSHHTTPCHIFLFHTPPSHRPPIPSAFLNHYFLLFNILFQLLYGFI